MLDNGDASRLEVVVKVALALCGTITIPKLLSGVWTRLKPGERLYAFVGAQIITVVAIPAAYLLLIHEPFFKTPWYIFILQLLAFMGVLTITGWATPTIEWLLCFWARPEGPEVWRKAVAEDAKGLGNKTTRDSTSFVDSASVEVSLMEEAQKGRV